MNILFLCTTDSMIWNFLISHIKRLESKGHNVECVCSVTGTFFQELVARSIVMHEIPFQRSPYSVRNIFAYKALYKLVKERQYDIIFCHEPIGGVMGRIVGKYCNVKVIYMAHGFHFYKGAPIINNILYYLVEKILSNWTDTLITINQEDYLASKKFYAKHNLLFKGIGVDINKFSSFEAHYFEENYNLPINSIKLLSVGELIPRKNHGTMIDSMLFFKGQDVYYFIAGEGELESELKRKVKDLGLENQVFFLGFCRNISELCNSCDYFIFPSVQEGLSKALMEAMACGKPIIASKIRGNVDLIQDGIGGFLVDTFNSEAYAKAVNKLIGNSELSDYMSKNNKETIKDFDIRRIEDNIVELFND